MICEKAKANNENDSQWTIINNNMWNYWPKNDKPIESQW